MSCETRADQRAIDASLKGPLAFIFGTAALWLLVGTVLGLIGSLQLNLPHLVEPCLGSRGGSWGWFCDLIQSSLTFGRVRPAQNAMLMFGWASLAGIGVSLWLMARMTGRSACKSGVLLAGAVLWNIGVLVGTVQVLTGNGTGVEGLEYQSNVMGILLIAYLFLGAGIAMMFRTRHCGPVYVSQWYLVGALFWFPWLLMTANVMIFCKPVQGALQAAVNAWYLGGIQNLWFAPVGMAALYYLIPALTGEKIHRYRLASTAFWMLAVLGGWTGLRSLVGGAVPAWMATVGVVASVLLIIPVSLTTLNQQVTLAKAWDKVIANPALWFLFFGGISFIVAVVLEAFLGFRTISAALRFSHFQTANGFVSSYAFFSMVMFGAVYTILPKVLGMEWSDCSLCAIRRHFWVVATGAILLWGSLALAGIFQGLGINYAKIHFVATVHLAQPFLWLVNVAALLLLWGHLIFIKVIIKALAGCAQSEMKGCCS